MSILSLFFYLTLLNWSIVTAIWFYSKKRNSFDPIIIYWGLGIVIMSWSAMLIQALLEDPTLNIRQLCANILVSLWGIRLSLYLKKRNFWEHGDPRYESIIKDIKANWTFQTYKKIFLFQGLFQLIVIAPILSLNFLPGPIGINVLDFVGLIVFLGGFFIENKADQALSKFRLSPENKSKALKKGLWARCRHPNYLGDIFQWWGLFLIACSATGGLWSFYGPLLMTWIFLNRSINTIEKRLLIQRPGYRDYIENTNKLLPNLDKELLNIMGWLQYLLPHKLLTIFAGYFCSSNNILVKNFLIYIFCFLYKPNLREAKISNLKEYDSFNNFFTRKLKPEARKIDSSESRVISPVDGAISSYGRIVKGELIQAKNFKFKLEDLLKDKDLEELFKDGSYITIYLAPSDYHRIHFSMDGTIKKTKHFAGSLYSVKKSSLKTITSLYTKNERTLVHVESDKLSYCLIAIGASMVGSIIPFWKKDKFHYREKISKAWDEGPSRDLIKVKKGQELGYFQMGSTVILLFPSSVNLNNNFLSESKAVKFGEAIIDLLEK